MKKQKIKKEKGFTLLFAVLLSVLVLAVGASVINIAMKQVILTGIGRESQFAFYAANTGVECALYWDYKNPLVFATSTDSQEISSGEKESIICARASIYNQDNNTIGSITDPGSNNSNYALSQFKVKFESPIEYCAIVTVTKERDTNTGITSTKIESRGYNTCDEGNPRRIERGLQLSY